MVRQWKWNFKPKKKIGFFFSRVFDKAHKLKVCRCQSLSPIDFYERRKSAGWFSFYFSFWPLYRQQAQRCTASLRSDYHDRFCCVRGRGVTMHIPRHAEGKRVKSIRMLLFFFYIIARCNISMSYFQKSCSCLYNEFFSPRLCLYLSCCASLRPGEGVGDGGVGAGGWRAAPRSKFTEWTGWLPASQSCHQSWKTLHFSALNSLTILKTFILLP